MFVLKRESLSDWRNLEEASTTCTRVSGNLSIEYRLNLSHSISGSSLANECSFRIFKLKAALQLSNTSITLASTSELEVPILARCIILSADALMVVERELL